MEQYRVRSCKGVTCADPTVAANIDQRCQVREEGTACRMSCFMTGQGCLECTYTFTRALSDEGVCGELNKCRLAAAVCPRAQVSLQVGEVEDDGGMGGGEGGYPGQGGGGHHHAHGGYPAQGYRK